MSAAFHTRGDGEKEQDEPEISQESERRLKPFCSSNLSSFPTFLLDGFEAVSQPFLRALGAIRSQAVVQPLSPGSTSGALGFLGEQLPVIKHPALVSEIPDSLAFGTNWHENVSFLARQVLAASPCREGGVAREGVCSYSISLSA